MRGSLYPANKVKSVFVRKNSHLMLGQGKHPSQPYKSYGTHGQNAELFVLIQVV